MPEDRVGYAAMAKWTVSTCDVAVATDLAVPPVEVADAVAALRPPGESPEADALDEEDARFRRVLINKASDLPQLTPDR